MASAKGNRVRLSLPLELAVLSLLSGTLELRPQPVNPRGHTKGKADFGVFYF